MKVIDGVYIGSIGSALSKDILKEEGITHIICAASKLNFAYPDDFIYQRYELLDSPNCNIAKYFNEAADYIENALKNGNGRVLVHCFAGKSRSSTLILAYMVKKCNMSLRVAYDQLRAARPIAMPNIGFKI